MQQLGTDGGISSIGGRRRVNQDILQPILIFLWIRNGKGSDCLSVFRPIRSILISIGRLSGLSRLTKECWGWDPPTARVLTTSPSLNGSWLKLKAPSIPSRNTGSRICNIFFGSSSLLLLVTGAFIIGVIFSYDEIVLQLRYMPPFFLSSDLTCL